MKLLFVHQNAPGQFRHLAPALARDPANQLVFVTRNEAALPGIRTLRYAPGRTAQAGTHPYVRSFENAVLHGQQVFRVLRELGREGFRPDVVIGHSGWGETLFAKDAFPDAKLLTYAEFYYHGRGKDLDFDPDSPWDMDMVLRARARNAHLTLALEASDAAYTPTQWQRSLHPGPLQPMIDVIFDGIDTATVHPDPAARFALPSGRVLDGGDEVVTYVARNLEPYRGFPAFMRSLPALLARRPKAEVLVAGGDGVSYGVPPPGYPSWRTRLLAELPGLDLSRVHFLGQVSFRAYLSLLQISSVHVYLTVPFVLSWSCLEAMAAGCLVVGSRTPPVEEVIADGHTGMLVDFFDPAALADQVATLLAGRGDPAQARMRAAARQTVLDRYGLPDCLARQTRLVRSLAGSGS